MTLRGNTNDRHGDGSRRPTASTDDPFRPAIFGRDEWERMTAAKKLSPGQIRVVGLIFQGKSNKQIHTILKTSSSNRRDHMHEAMRKLGAASRNEIPYRITEVFRDLYG
jgi:DNA-binding NarL/FixJ family response regulator